MYQVSFKFKTLLKEPYYDCVFFDNEEDALVYYRFMKTFGCYLDIKIASNSIDNLLEANEEIQRLRELLSQSYVELQQLKEGYNEFIQTR